MKPTKLEFTFKSMVYLFVLVLSILGTITFLGNVKQLLVIFIVAFIISESLHPNVTKLEKVGLPRFAAVLIIYALVIGILSFAIAGVIPVFIEQSNRLAVTGPLLLNNLQIAGYPIDVSSVFRIFESLPSILAVATVAIFSNLVQAVLILVITFYMVMQRPLLNISTLSFLDKKRQLMVFDMLHGLEKRLAAWIMGQFILVILVGSLNFIGYSFIGLEFAISLAIIAGILEVVPNVGPALAAVLAGIVGLATGSPLTALLAITVGIIVQQLENHLIVPKIMKETVGLNPLVTIMILLIGGQVGGVLGAILAVPVFISLEEIIKTYVKYQRLSKVTNKPNSV